MSRPVQIKIFFGSLIVTKRQYLTMSAAGFLALAAFWIAFRTVFAPGTAIGTIIMREGPWVYDVIPWLLGVGAVVELIETAVVLGMFRRREEFLRRERGYVTATPETAD